MSNLQNASLVLNTYTGIDTSDPASLTKTSHTWYNINLRTLLGDMYNKYDMFNICLNTVATEPLGTAFNKASKDLQVIMRVSGLPFINNTYNVSVAKVGTDNTFVNNNTPYCVIGTFTFASTGPATQYFYGSNIATFGKNQELCNITIDYVRIADLARPEVATSQKFPNVSFIFDIFGIEKDDKNKNGTRINID